MYIYSSLRDSVVCSVSASPLAFRQFRGCELAIVAYRKSVVLYATRGRASSRCYYVVCG